MYDEKNTYEENDSNEVEEYNTGNNSEMNGYSLGWHKVMMVLFIIGAIYGIIMGIVQMTGLIYQGKAGRVYSYYEGLQTLDIIYGLAMIAVSIWQFVVRGALNNFRTGAVKQLTAFYIVSVAMSIVYIFAADAITGVNMADGSTVAKLLGAVAMAIVNIVYYRNRKELFVC